MLNLIGGSDNIDLSALRGEVASLSNMPDMDKMVIADKYFIKLDNNNKVIEVHSYYGIYVKGTDNDKIQEYQGYIDIGLEAIRQAQIQKELEAKKEAYKLVYEAKQNLLTESAERELQPTEAKKIYQPSIIAWLKMELPAYLKAEFINPAETDESILLSESNMRFVLNEATLQQAQLQNQNERGILAIFETLTSFENSEGVLQLLQIINTLKLQIADVFLNPADEVKSKQKGSDIILSVYGPLSGFLRKIKERIESNSELSFIQNIEFIKDFTLATAIAETELEKNPTSLINKIIYNLLQGELFNLLGASSSEHLKAIIEDIAGSGVLTAGQINFLINSFKQAHSQRRK